ncbi:MAG TPA: Ig-like domain-containing protein, partial [Verrucomicrobiota bacterium]|nr:Ig-like domain-containing protein [Verrucomicrobiota bacterium]
NTGLIPNPTVTYTSPNTTGTLTFTPVTNANGSATITVTVSDGQSQNGTFSRSFNITVNSVNNPPVFNPLNNLTINEDAAQQTVNLSGINSGAANESQTLSFTATSSNTGLIPNPTVTYTSPNTTGTLRFTPVADANGTAIITVTLSDGVDEFARTFTVTVNAINDAPTLNALSNLAINEDAGQQTVNLSGINSGATNENQTLSVTATSSNTGLIPNPTVIYTSPNTTGSLSFTPVSGTRGSAIITVTVSDGQSQNSTTSRTFTVSVNGAPTITKLDDVTIYANTNTGPIAFEVGDSETPAANLIVWATSSNPSLVSETGIILGGGSSNRTVTLTPVVEQTGEATVTLTVSDGSVSSETSFQLTVLPPVPAPPSNLVVVITNGLGSVTSSAGLQAMVADKTYTLTAVPVKGQLFVGW